MPPASSSLRKHRPPQIRKLIDALRDYQIASDRLRQEMCAGLGINRTDARSLDLLELYGEQTAGELADRAGVSTGAMTGVLDRLERRGYVERIRDPEDRRRIRVAITKHGFAESSRFWGPAAARLDRVIAGLNDEEMALLAGLHRDMAEALTPAHPAP